MKGNHNRAYDCTFLVGVVINMSKIQNERKSQHVLRTFLSTAGCN